jgi:hypothetical protein
MSTFTNFSALPKELRDMIWQQTAPTAATISFCEDEYLVTHISPPPSLLTTSKEAQTTALSWKNLTKYPIWGPQDWEDLRFDAEKLMLQLIINPTTSRSDDASNITWMDIWSVLGDVLIAVRRMHIVCNRPERLAMLFILEEGKVGVGQSCVESGLFNNPESVKGERETRDSLYTHLTVTAGKHTVEEINDEGGEVDVWRLGDEEVFDDFGTETKSFTTKASECVDVEKAEKISVMQLHNAAKTSALPVSQARVKKEGEGAEEEVVEKAGIDLTEDALARHLAEMEKLYPKTVSEEDEKDPRGSACPEFG